MTECARCGDCCDPVHLPISPADIAAMREAQMNAYGKRTTDMKTMAWLQGLVPAGKYYDQRQRRMVYLYQCPHFTAERTCAAHGMRPPTCSRYPWYEKAPYRGDTTMGGRCSFLADVYPMLPIVEVRHGRQDAGTEAARHRTA